MGYNKIKTITFLFGRFIQYDTVGSTSKIKVVWEIQFDEGIIVPISIVYAHIILKSSTRDTKLPIPTSRSYFIVLLLIVLVKYSRFY